MKHVIIDNVSSNVTKSTLDRSHDPLTLLLNLLLLKEIVQLIHIISRKDILVLLIGIIIQNIFYFVIVAACCRSG